MPDMEITFHGGAGTVTGSKSLVRAGRTRVLVDCGLFQGLKALRERNWRPPPVEPSSLDAVLLTHAHIDHSGYLPILVRDGFRGPIYCTPPTKDLCRILLADSGRIQEEDAAYANRKGFSKHRPALPLFTEEDAARVSRQLKTVRPGEEIAIGDLKADYRLAGHILGAASVCLRANGSTMLFSGDLGRSDSLLFLPPEVPGAPDAVAMESTYGDRLHERVDPVAAVGEVLARTVARKGVVLVAAFAVGRSQKILYAVEQAFRRGLAPRVPVYLNSPMAQDVTELYERHVEYHRLTPRDCDQICGSATFVRSVDESKALNRRRGPMVIVSASGMLTGGRILHHLRAFADNPANTILLPGYQAPGTRGAALLNGVRSLKIHGSQVPVRAEVVQLGFFSAHADQQELIGWLAAAERPPRRVLLVHGDAEATEALRQRCHGDLGLVAEVPAEGTRVTLP